MMESKWAVELGLPQLSGDVAPAGELDHPWSLLSDHDAAEALGRCQDAAGRLPANSLFGRFAQAATVVLSRNQTGWAEKRWLEAAGAASVSAVPPDPKLASLAPPAAGYHDSAKFPELDAQEVPEDLRPALPAKSSLADAEGGEEFLAFPTPQSRPAARAPPSPVAASAAADAPPAATVPPAAAAAPSSGDAPPSAPVFGSGLWPPRGADPDATSQEETEYATSREETDSVEWNDGESGESRGLESELESGEEDDRHVDLN